MATNAWIGVLNPDNSVEYIYCHFGSLSDAGTVLIKSYVDEQKVKELLQLGDISVLGGELNPPSGVEHSFGNPHQNVVVAYGRDRGEVGTKSKVCQTLEQFAEEAKANWIDLIYLYRGGLWNIITPEGSILPSNK